MRSAAPGPAAVLLPRCRRAVAALEDLTSGFYLTERIESGQLRLRTKKGGWESVSLDAASAEYLNLIRDAGHTLRQKMTNERDLSLFVANNGEVDPGVADVPFVHLIRLLADPTDLKMRLQRAKGLSEGTPPGRVPICESPGGSVRGVGRNSAGRAKARVTL